MMRGRSVKLRPFDHGDMIGIMTEPNPFAFMVSIETAEQLIDDLRDVLKQAAHVRREHRLDVEAGVYGPYISKIL